MMDIDTTKEGVKMFHQAPPFDLYSVLLMAGIIIAAGFVSVLRWLNSPVPSRTWGQAVLAYFNGMFASFMASLYFGDKLLAGDLTLLQFALLLMLAGMGGAQVLNYVWRKIAKKLKL